MNYGVEFMSDTIDMLTAKYKEHVQKIDSLSNENRELKAQVAALRRDNDELDSRLQAYTGIDGRLSEAQVTAYNLRQKLQTLENKFKRVEHNLSVSLKVINE